jgi:hypothetical protein
LCCCVVATPTSRLKCGVCFHLNSHYASTIWTHITLALCTRKCRWWIDFHRRVVCWPCTHELATSPCLQFQRPRPLLRGCVQHILPHFWVRVWLWVTYEQKTLLFLMCTTPCTGNCSFQLEVYYRMDYSRIRCGWDCTSKRSLLYSIA